MSPKAMKGGPIISIYFADFNHAIEKTLHNIKPRNGFVLQRKAPFMIRCTGLLAHEWLDRAWPIPAWVNMERRHWVRLSKSPKMTKGSRLANDVHQCCSCKLVSIYTGRYIMIYSAGWCIRTTQRLSCYSTVCYGRRGPWWFSILTATWG